MSSGRRSVVVGGFVILVAASCGGSGGGTADGGAPHVADASPSDTTTTHSGSDAGVDGHVSIDAAVDAAAIAPQPPDLISCVAATAQGAGLVITWSRTTPCDSIDVERQDQIHGFPSTEHPAQPPQFPGIVGGLKAYTDGTATDPTFFFSYRARCVVGATASGWSNIVQHAGN